MANANWTDLAVWLGQLSSAHQGLSFLLVNGETRALEKPLHFGETFVAGKLGDDRAAIPYHAIAFAFAW